MLVRSQKGIVHLGLLILLLLGLVAGVYLVQHPQIFKSKATGELIWLIDENGNRLSPKDGEVYEVSSREIRIKINQPDWLSQPQSKLPNLVTIASAQSSQCNGNIYSCMDIKCPDGSLAPGTGCYETGGDPNNRYSTECLRNCPVNPASNIQPAPNTGSDNSSATTCAYKNGICATDSGRTSDGRSCSSWLKGEPYPDCNNVYYYCFSQNSCTSAAITPSQEDVSSPPFIPTPSPSSREESEVVEATQQTRVSLVRNYIQKDGPCESNSDLGSTCKELTFVEISQGYLSWTLPDKEGEHTIYVGFISNKGNYKETSLRIRYTTTPSISTSKKEQPQDEVGAFLRLFSFQKGKSGETKVKGKLVVVHGDNLHTKQSFQSFVIQHVDQSGVPHYYNLKFKESGVRLPQSGSEIEIEGSLEGQTFNVNRVLTQVLTPAAKSIGDYPQILAASGGKIALLTYVRWSDNNQQYFSGDLLKYTILEVPNYPKSSSKFLKNASFGNNLEITQLDFSSTEITVPVSGMTCDINYEPTILTAIDRSPPPPSGYDIYIFI